MGPSCLLPVTLRRGGEPSGPGRRGERRGRRWGAGATRRGRHPVTRTSRTSGLLAVLAAGTLALAACGSNGGYGSSGSSGSQNAGSSASAPAASGAALKTASTSLGTVVVDGSG